MSKKITLILLLLTSMLSNAQDYSMLWEGYFSYYKVIDVSQSATKLFAASENAIFTYDFNSHEIQTITTIEGLSGETITTIYYSETFQTLMIGFDNGLIEIYKESDQSILSVVDILEKVTIAPNKKRINHFNEIDGLVYISTDYGISVYDLAGLEFGDSYFIGNGGSQISVKQTTQYGDFIYAACGDNGAVKKAEISNPNLIDYQQWQTLNNGNFLGIESVGDQLYAIKTNRVLYEIVNDNFNIRTTYQTLPVDMRSVDDNLIVTTASKVHVYDNEFNNLSIATSSLEFETSFTSATTFSEELFIGTMDFGVLQTQTLNPLEFVEVRPDGPLSNQAFKINAQNEEVWVTYGDYTITANPYPLRSFGVSHLENEQWNNIPYDSLLTARNLTYIAINPFNPKHVFISSFQDGLLEIGNGVATNLYNQNNSALESLIDPSDPNVVSIRVSGLEFDRTGVLWSVTSRVDKALKSYDPSTNSWQSYSFGELIADALGDELGFSDLVIGNNGYKWIASVDNGVIGYDDATQQIKNISSIDQNLPSTAIKALAIDQSNQLWIGTIKGLRILYNTGNFFETANPSVNEIVIIDDGQPSELLAGQFISDIKVDGSNNKWVGTADSGLFYFSPNGQETIYHFTTDNSPLPSNIINDISIDANSGKVYIATQNGLVSFKSGGTKPGEVLNDAYVYPNPVRPEYNILGGSDLNNINNGVKIKGLTENVNVKITDIEGNLVAEAQSRINLRSSRSRYNFAIDGGTAIWNGRNLANHIVATGVYLIMISDLDSFETKTLKLLIVR